MPFCLYSTRFDLFTYLRLDLLSLKKLLGLGYFHFLRTTQIPLVGEDIYFSSWACRIINVNTTSTFNNSTNPSKPIDLENPIRASQYLLPESQPAKTQKCLAQRSSSILDLPHSEQSRTSAQSHLTRHLGSSATRNSGSGSRLPFTMRRP